MIENKVLRAISLATKTFIFVLLFLLPVLARAQDTFRVESVGGVDFILPPKSKLKLEGDTVKNKYQYHFVQFTKLEGNYIRSLTAIQNAKYYFSRRPNGREEGGTFESKACEHYCAIKDDGDDFVLRIDYGEMFDRGHFVGDFNKLGLDLLKYFSKEEDRTNDSNMTGPRKTKWAGSISQDIVEKIFELIPVPQESSLARFGVFSKDERVVLLLNPKFTLQIDIAQRVVTGPETFRFDLGSQTFVRLFRRQFSGSTFSFLRQRPLLAASNGKYETNFYSYPDGQDSESRKLVLLSSPGDPQMSKSINTSKFVAFYERVLKRNNGVVTGSNACDAANVNPQDCIYRNNSYLLFDQTIANFYEDPLCDGADCAPTPPQPIRAVFGERNAITPLLSVLINGQSIDVPVNSTVFDLIQTGRLIRRSRMYRAHRSGYARFKELPMETLLLPGDSFLSR